MRLEVHYFTAIILAGAAERSDERFPCDAELKNVSSKLYTDTN